jgi:hypothetical protein
VHDPTSALPPWTWVLVALGAVLLLTAIGLLVLGSRWALFRVRWLREAELKKRRGMGLPKEGGSLTVVVTDVEGYSGERRVAGPFHGRYQARGAPPRCGGRAVDCPHACGPCHCS